MVNRREIKRCHLRISKKIKNILLSPKSKEFLIFLFFAFISTSFWLLQTLNDDYEANITIPLRLKEIPESTVLTTEPPARLNITVKDKGIVLFNYLITKKFYPITLDFSSYVNNNQHVKLPAAEIEKRVMAQLNASTHIIALNPDTIEYIYSTGKSKFIPIKVNGKITAGREYYIPDTLIRPDSVLVYAPPDMLKEINYAITEPVEVEDISDTTHLQAKLQSIKGVKFYPNEVRITLPVDIYTEKTVEVPIKGRNFPANKILRTFPPRVSVSFQVGLSNFKNINAEDFSIRPSFEELNKLPSYKYKVSLKTCPTDIRNVRISPEEIDFLIEQTESDVN